MAGPFQDPPPNVAQVRGQTSPEITGLQTYRTGLNAQTFYSTAAAVMVEIVGSATKTIRVKHILIWLQAATKFYTELALQRCTGVSGGTPNVVTLGTHDTKNATATAVVNNYTAAATAGAGAVVTGMVPIVAVPPSATIAAIGADGWDFCRSGSQGFVLRGTGDVLEVFNTIIGFGAGTYGFEIEWTEDNS